jgi:hypothetical protein
MSHKRVPSSVASPRGKPFPEGLYLGHIASAKEEWNQDQTRLGLTVQFVDNTVIDGNDEPGARPFFRRILLVQNAEITDARGRKQTEEFIVFDADLENEGTPFPIRSAGTELTQLAVALGAATDKDNFITFEEDMEVFVEELKNGVYNGDAVQFDVSHRAWSNEQTGRSGIAINVTFSAAEEEYEAPEAAPAPEPEAPAEPEVEDVVPAEKTVAKARGRSLRKS